MKYRRPDRLLVSPPFSTLAFVATVFASLLAAGCAPPDAAPAASAATDEPIISGTIHFEDGSTLEFAELRSLIFSLVDGAESIPQNANEWPHVFDPASWSRSAPLSWIRTIEVTGFETQEGYRCLFNPTVVIETVSGATIESEYKTLEWIKVRAIDTETRALKTRQVFFAEDGQINIRKIVLNIG